MQAHLDAADRLLFVRPPAKRAAVGEAGGAHEADGAGAEAGEQHALGDEEAMAARWAAREVEITARLARGGGA